MNDKVFIDRHHLINILVEQFTLGENSVIRLVMATTNVQEAFLLEDQTSVNAILIICLLIFGLLAIKYLLVFFSKFKKKEGDENILSTIERYFILLSISFFLTMSILFNRAAVFELIFYDKLFAVGSSVFCYIIIFIALKNVLFEKYYHGKSYVNIFYDSFMWLINFILFSVSLYLFILTIWQFFVNSNETFNMEYFFLLLAAIMTFLFLAVTTYSVSVSKQSLNKADETLLEARRERLLHEIETIEHQIEPVKAIINCYDSILIDIDEIFKYTEKTNKIFLQETENSKQNIHESTINREYADPLFYYKRSYSSLSDQNRFDSSVAHFSEIINSEKSINPILKGDLKTFLDFLKAIYIGDYKDSINSHIIAEYNNNILKKDILPDEVENKALIKMNDYLDHYGKNTEDFMTQSYTVKTKIKEEIANIEKEFLNTKEDRLNDLKTQYDNF